VLGQIGLGQGGGLASAYQENHTWFWNFVFQAHYDLVADGITLPLLVVVTTIFGCAIFHSWKVHERVRLYGSSVLLVETAVNGVLCSADFLLFAAFWGLLLVPMYLLIRIWGGDGAAPRRRMVRRIPGGVTGTDHRDHGHRRCRSRRADVRHGRQPDQAAGGR